jgi:hypothetical protein
MYWSDKNSKKFKNSYNSTFKEQGIQISPNTVMAVWERNEMVAPEDG